MKGIDHGKAFRSGVRPGTKVRSTGLSKASNWTAGSLFTKRNNASNNGKVRTSNPNDKGFDPGLLGVVMECDPQPDITERVGPYKRQSEEVEKAWLRENRGFRKCSRDCKPKLKGGFGCQLWRQFPSCPQPEDEEAPPRLKPQVTKHDPFDSDEELAW